MQEWEERRKKAVLRNYYKDLKKEGYDTPKNGQDFIKNEKTNQ